MKNLKLVGTLVILVVNMKNNCEFLVGHISVGKFTFIKIGF